METNSKAPGTAQNFTFSSFSERDSFYQRWVRKQKKEIRYGSAGEYVGDKEVLGMAGKTISISRK